MKKKTVAVLFGGCSTEYDVSLQSAYSVIRSLDAQKYDVITLGITPQGRWLKYGGYRTAHGRSIPPARAPLSRPTGALAAYLLWKTAASR
jgi:D-alanine-D-alanine ligase-like ATP-grasp enzyme